MGLLHYPYLYKIAMFSSCLYFWFPKKSAKIFAVYNVIVNNCLSAWGSSERSLIYHELTFDSAQRSCEYSSTASPIVFVRKIFLSESDHTTQGAIFKFFREYHHLVWAYASYPVMISQPSGKNVTQFFNIMCSNSDHLITMAYIEEV